LPNLWTPAVASKGSVAVGRSPANEVVVAFVWNARRRTPCGKWSCLWADVIGDLGYASVIVP